MATYVNDLRLKEITTGDESGTWGTSTNTNLELIAEAFSYGTEVITTNADTHTTTIADGATDPGRSLYLKYTGTLDSACTITIGPNTVSKVWIIENGTSGSQDIIISQGSGANITIPAGDTKVVYSDGAGAGAAFFDAFANLKVTDPAQTNITSVGTLSALTGGTGDLNWDSGTLFVDSSANNVGIGTTSVGTKLNIRSDASDDGILLEKSDGTDIARLFHDGTSTNARFDMFSGGSATVQIKASGNTHFSGGNVGIGESSPQELLHLTATTPVFRMQGGSRTYQQFVSGTDFVIRDVTATANRIYLDSSGNLLVGTTDSFPGGGDTNTGVSLTNSGAVVASRDGDFAARFNRKTSDGDIVQFNIDGTTVGSIGSTSGFFFIGGTEGTDAYISFGSAGVRPATSAGAARDAAVDLGGSTNRFKDLYLSGGVYGGGAFSAGNTGTGNFFAEGGQHVFRKGSGGSYAEFGRFDVSGNFLVGTTSAAGEGFTIYPAGGAGSTPQLLWNRPSSATSGAAALFRNGGTNVGSITYTNTATSYVTSSDYRLKEDDVPMTGATERVKALRPINFAWKADGSRVDGFLAHEAQEVVPECVTGTKDAMRDEEYEVTPAVYEDVITPAVEAVAAVLDADGLVITEAVEAVAETTESVLVTEAVMGTRSVPDYQGIDQSKLVPLLTAALQEAITKIEDLTTRLETLENA
jgi:hypothetical protein